MHRSETNQQCTVSDSKYQLIAKSESIRFGQRVYQSSSIQITGGGGANDAEMKFDQFQHRKWNQGKIPRARGVCHEFSGGNIHSGTSLRREKEQQEEGLGEFGSCICLRRHFWWCGEGI